MPARDIVSDIAKKMNSLKRVTKVADFKFKNGMIDVDETYEICSKQFIYKITNKVNGKVYIGQTGGLFKHLIQRYQREYIVNSDRFIIRAMRKYGITNFRISIVEIVENTNDLNDRESYYINFFRSSIKGIGYNLTIGGDGARGYKYSKKRVEEMKIRMKGRGLGSKNYFYGKKHSKETIAKIVESNKRRRGEQRKSKKAKNYEKNGHN